MENKEVNTDAKEGEWIVEGRFIYILHNPDGRYPRNKFHAQVTPDWFGKVSDQEAENVAHVFGAAHDMLEALKSIAEENYDDDDKKRHLRSTIDRIKDTAEAAIKKAQPHE